jgi:hypothetical protein
MNRPRILEALSLALLLVGAACSSDDSSLALDNSGGGGIAGNSVASAGSAQGGGGAAGAFSDSGTLTDATDASETSAPDGGVEAPFDAAEATTDVAIDAVPQDPSEAAVDATDATNIADGSDANDGGAEASSDVSVSPDALAAEASTADASDAYTEEASTSPCGTCNGICLDGGPDGGICVECVDNSTCPAGRPHCDVNDHACVQCLPGAADDCPSGQYCADTLTCVPGCKYDSACASGVCNNHDCAFCQSDAECSGGRVCGSGTCAATCSPLVTCAAGFDCCGDHCIDLAVDIQHCGSCGAACGASQFCGTSGCNSVAIANLCDNAKTTMVLDASPPDNASNAVMQTALTDHCAPAPTTDSLVQGATGVVNPSTGQPVAGGGNLLTVAGGYYVQPIVDYLDNAGATPVYLSRIASDHYQYLLRGGGSDAGAEGGAIDPVIATIATTDSTATKDLILVELVRDPRSGTLLLVSFGQHAEGTAAAARYVATQMLPAANRATYTQSWYVYMWSAASEAGPETFGLIASGH